MRADAAEADRRQAVRTAARAWHEAGEIDEALLRAVDERYPDDRVRARPVFRVLLAGFTVLAGLAATGLLLAAGRETPVVPIVLGLGAALLAEVQVGPLRRAESGTAGASAFLAVVLLVAGLTWAANRDLNWGPDATLRAATRLSAVLAGAVAWRWGMAVAGGLSAAAAFLLLAQLPVGRASWLLLPLVAVPLLDRGARTARLAPSHRTALRLAEVVALAALAVATNPWAHDVGVVERMGELPPAGPGALRLLCMAAFVLLPAAALVVALRRRETWLLWAAVAMTAASAVTFRHYVHLGPLWAVLAAAGIVLVVLAMVARRVLDSGRNKERRGLTAEPLFGDERRVRLAELAVSMATLTPEAKPPEPKPSFEAGGGSFGGGGASDSF
jgi:hypothetical protein